MSEGENGDGTGDGTGGAGSGNGEGAGDWLTGLDDGQRAVAENKGWTGPADVINGYRELESFRGVPADRLLKLPDPSSESPDDWAHVYTALGRPENVDGYELALPEGVELSQPRVDAFKQKAFEIGLNSNQVNALAAWDSEFMTGITGQANEQTKLQAQEDVAAMRKEWGAAFDRKVGQMDAGQAAFGISGEEVERMDQVFGRKRTMEMLANIGARMGEDSLDDVRGGSGDGKFSGISPSEADEKLRGLRMDDSFMTKYKAGNPDAVAQFDSLMRLKHGG